MWKKYREEEGRARILRLLHFSLKAVPLAAFHIAGTKDWKENLLRQLIGGQFGGKYG